MDKSRDFNSKATDPDFEELEMHLPGPVVREVRRRLAETGGNLSDLLEQLLQEYIERETPADSDAKPPKHPNT